MIVVIIMITIILLLLQQQQPLLLLLIMILSIILTNSIQLMFMHNTTNNHKGELSGSPRSSREVLGKGQRGSALMGSLQLLMFSFDRGTFSVLPLTYCYLPKSARAYLFPRAVKLRYLCSGPISVDPICLQPICVYLYLSTSPYLSTFLSLPPYLYLSIYLSVSPSLHLSTQLVTPLVLTPFVRNLVNFTTIPYIYIYIHICIYTYTCILYLLLIIAAATTTTTSHCFFAY